MTTLLTTRQMRDVEAAAFDAGTDSLALMERAGRETLAAILEEWPDLEAAPHHAVVLAGPGNNGGDGYVIARRLADRGWRVEVLALGSLAKMPPDARRNREIWETMGGTRPITPEAAEEGARPDLLVDALFGIGIARPLSDDLAAARAAVRRRPPGARRCRVAAVDCLSGLDGDTGQVLMPEAPGEDAAEAALDDWHGQSMARAMPVDLTVTGHAPKLGHYLALGPAVSGRLVARDIGISAHDENEPAPTSRPGPVRVRLVDYSVHGRDVSGPALRSLLAPHGHKYDRGHVAVLSGGPGKGGAARMAARAALRTGAGLVTLACPPGALQENASRLDAVMTRSLKDAGALAEWLTDDRLSGLVLGPGLGVGETTRTLVRAALAAERGTVLDADALTSFADDPDALFSALHDRAVLTPHGGEFARLFPDLGEAARSGDKIAAARDAALRAGATILLKGPDTVIASPDGAVSVHAAAYDRASPWLATAGAGDVLAGILGALAGRPWGADVHVAAEAAAWLHVEAARAVGPGLIAEDIPEALPGVFRRLGL